MYGGGGELCCFGGEKSNQPAYVLVHLPAEAQDEGRYSDVWGVICVMPQKTPRRGFREFSARYIFLPRVPLSSFGA